MELIKIEGTHEEEKKKLENKEVIRVAGYIRVSTDFDGQENSYASQEKYYRNKINDVHNWELVDIYGDEGITGTKVEKRPGFMRLIRDANNGKIDLILTKSISRFARNTVDTLKYVRLLKSKNVGIIFEEEKIDTLKISGEFLITVLGAIAEQEAYNLSAHTQLGLKMKMIRGENVGFLGCYGYKMVKETKTLEIAPKQAKVVKKIFDMYLKGYSLKQIKRYLEEKKIKTFTNKDNWSSRTIRGMLLNEKYVGDLTLGKSSSKKTIAKIKNDEMYYIKNHHKAIIDRDTFDKVGKMLAVNHTKYNNKWREKTVFSGNLKCGFCGKSVIRRNRGKEDRKEDYYCSSVLKGFWTDCPKSNVINIELIKSCFIKAMKKLYRKFKCDLITGLEDYEYNYVYKILCENEKCETFKEDFYKKIIKYVIIGDEENNKINPYNIHFVIRLEDDIFDYSQYIGEDAVFNQEKKRIFSFENQENFRYFKYDKKGRRHLNKLKSHTISVEYERNLWK